VPILLCLAPSFAQVTNRPLAIAAQAAFLDNRTVVADVFSITKRSLHLLLQIGVELALSSLLHGLPGLVLPALLVVTLVDVLLESGDGGFEVWIFQREVGGDGTEQGASSLVDVGGAESWREFVDDGPLLLLGVVGMPAGDALDQECVEVFGCGGRG